MSANAMQCSSTESEDNQCTTSDKVAYQRVGLHWALTVSSCLAFTTILGLIDLKRGASSAMELGSKTSALVRREASGH